MRVVDYVDKGASLGERAACFVAGERTYSYGDVVALTNRIARALGRSGIEPGAKIAILASNDPVAFACVFGASRAGAVWCPINPRNEAGENRFVLDAFDCSVLIFQHAYAPLVERIRGELPKLKLLVCLDGEAPGAAAFASWIRDEPGDAIEVAPPDDLAMIAGTGGTTGVPKGVMLSGRNLEAMSALTLMNYPFAGRPVYLALAPLTHAAGVLCLPVMALGGEIVILTKPDLNEFLDAIERRRVTHTFLPPTLIYALLAHPDLAARDLSSLQTFWYGAAPMSPVRLREAIERIGPVMAQLFGQTEAPMMIASLAPRDHFRDDGSIALERLASAGRPGPLVHVAIMDDAGALLPTGERGEIVVRGSLVMDGYYENPEATAEASRFGWHHTGDVGYLDGDGYLFIVDRAKDMIITGGFNVYSIEVENALMQHPDVQDCAVFGLPDDKWGEMVSAVVQPRAGAALAPAELVAFVKDRIGSVKAPKLIEVWPDLPRSKVGKVLKKDVRATVLAARAATSLSNQGETPAEGNSRRSPRSDAPR